MRKRRDPDNEIREFERQLQKAPTDLYLVNRYIRLLERFGWKPETNRRVFYTNDWTSLVWLAINGDHYDRQNAIVALGELKNLHAVPIAIEFLKDTNLHTNLRYAATRALKKLKHPDSIPVLIETLKDDEEEVRKGAAGALGKIKDSIAIPYLIELMRDENLQRDDMSYHDDRRDAAFALGEIGDPSAIPALIEASQEGLPSMSFVGLFGHYYDHNYDMRIAAIVALGRIGDPIAVPDLLELLEVSHGEMIGYIGMSLNKCGYDAIRGEYN
jgi:HEAT repeat protein